MSGPVVTISMVEECRERGPMLCCAEATESQQVSRLASDETLE